MAKMTASMRKAVPSSEFGMPGSRKYPMPDKSHAANAKARATQMVAKGKLSPSTAAKIRAKANKVLGCVLIFALFCATQARAAVTTTQVTIGASATQLATVVTQCNWIVIQNNATHAMRIGDSTVTSSKGILLASGSPGGSFYQGPLPTGGATDLSTWWVAGTQNDVVDVTCNSVKF